MIALVRGEVAIRRADHVVVDCGGVGYRLAVSAETLKHVPAVGQQVTLHAHLIPRDDALALFGFHAEAERDLFLALIGVQSVGPKVALAVLSGGTPRDLLSAPSPPATSPASRPFPALASAPPSGSSSSCGRRSPRARRRRRSGSSPTADDPRVMAREGLLGLGFSLPEADALLADAPGESAEELISAALRGARK